MTYYKIMWLPNTKEIIWDMKTEQQIASEDKIYDILLGEGFRLNEWIDSFSFSYTQWLAGEPSSVHKIDSELYSETISILTKTNLEQTRFRLFLWFDVDRYEHPNYHWKKCPLSERKLIDLGADYPINNRLVSEKFPIAFPAI